MTKQPVNPAQLYDGTPFGMSQAVLDADNSLVFVSGQVDWDQAYQISQDTISGQLEAALANLETALSAAGTSVEGLLEVRLYVRGELEEHMESLVPAFTAFLSGCRPAVTALGVTSLASKATLVEVAAVAKVD